VSHRRVIRIIGYEGLDSWVTKVLGQSPLKKPLNTLFRKQGTVREIARIELDEDEELVGLAGLEKRKRS
jgi:hypothetical protein